VLITGITGFTGGHLAELCVSKGLEVYGLGFPTNNVYLRQRLVGVTDIYNVDIRDGATVCSIIRKLKPEYIIHLAGLIGNEDLQKLLEINVVGTSNILEASLGGGAKILVPGSAAEYGRVSQNSLPISEDVAVHPIDNYGVSKASQIVLAHMYLRSYRSRVYLPRPFNVTGPGEYTRLVCSSIVKQFVDIQMGNRESVIYVGNLETQRDFVDVRDVVRAYWLILESGMPGEIYNICSGKAFSIRDIIGIISRILSLQVLIKQEISRVRAYDVPIQIGENEKIRKHTGWQCEIEIERSLSDLIQYHVLLSEAT